MHAESFLQHFPSASLAGAEAKLVERVHEGTYASVLVCIVCELAGVHVCKSLSCT